MAEPTETTALLNQTDGESDSIYMNMAFDGRRPSTGSMTGYSEAGYLTVDEFQYRLQYAFLRSGYDVEGDLRLVIRDCDSVGLDQLLQTLNSTPLPIQQKIRLSRILRSEGKTKRRIQQGTKKIEKMSDTAPLWSSCLEDIMSVKLWWVLMMLFQIVHRLLHVNQMRQSTDSILRAFHLWDDTITKLAAYFGSNVASYFRFVRTLVYMNLFIAVIMLAFVTVPELVDGKITSNITFGGHFGELSDSIMFYGLYTPDLDFTYNLPLAYFLSWLAANLLCFVFIIIIMIIRYKKKKLSEDKANEYRFSWRTFCMWDYSITSRQGVIDHRTSLRTDIKEIVKEEQSEVEESLSIRCGKYFMRLFSNTVVLGLLVGSGFLIYEVAESDYILPDSAPDDWKDFFRKYQLTAVVAGLKFLVPPIFHQIVVIEGWHPRIETKITLARTTLFYIASLVVFVSSLYKVTDDCQAQNTTMIPDNEACCWENEVGEEVLKVILLDLGLLVTVGILVHFTRAVFVKSCCKFLGYSKFDVVSCVLDVIYGQSLVWMGLYFSPLLGLLGLVKLVVVFYIRFTIAKVAMVPPQQMFRASSTGNFFLAILLLNMFVSLFPMAYAVIEFSPSPRCGPFSKFDYPYEVVSAIVGDLPDWLEDILDFLGTTSFLVPVLVLLIMSTVYFKVKSSSYNSLVTELRRQLKFERKVEKRKIFATGRAMSNVSLSQYSAPESPSLQPRDRTQPQKPIEVIQEVDEEINSSI